MANTRGADTRELGDEELVAKLKESKEELFNLRFQVATGQLDNNRRLQTVRRDIARIYTVMRERELGITYAVAAADQNESPAADAVEPSSEQAGASA
jgi:large subunit ribosomal protein L29